ncbi:LuxR C-terminal-related transcriptional regulator [Actinospongicola halichondriae]|uniref:LuxR C-terminal-related transcriptional regulator n=1 Tax=Actinospongicola halichondriae TaxID=3236844 RepID=UPI003D50D3C3
MTNSMQRAVDAITRHDWQDALDLARQAAGEVEGSAEADRLDLLADAAWWLGRLDDCIEAREGAYRVYDELGDHRSAGQCAVWLYEHHQFRMRPTIAATWLRRARTALEADTDCVSYGALALREAEMAHGRGELDAAVEATGEVLELARRLRSADLEAEALQTLGRLLIDRSEPAEGLARLDDAMLFALEGRLGPYATGKVYCSLISACEELGDLARAAEWTHATAEWSEQHPFAIFPGICRVHQAVVLKRQGSLAEAAAEAERAGEELMGSHLPNAAAAYAEMGDIRRRLGDLVAAEASFSRARELNGQVCGAYALLCLAQGKLRAARDAVGECMANCGSTPLSRAKVLPIFAHIAIAAGDLDAAAEAADELDDIAHTYASPFLRATAASTRGRLQLAADDPGAVETLRTALQDWESLQVPYEVATARTLVGQALQLAGDAAGAAESFASAAALFDEIGASFDARLAHGDTPSPTLPAGLTEREVEVLRLIASGMTNNEMAEALFLSAKTVSRHLSNIFTKIGVSSRAAATAFAFEHDLVANDTKR